MSKQSDGVLLLCDFSHVMNEWLADSATHTPDAVAQRLCHELALLELLFIETSGLCQPSLTVC